MGYGIHLLLMLMKLCGGKSNIVLQNAADR